MDIKKFRWSRVYESSEEELVQLLENRGIKATRVVIESPSELVQQILETNCTIWCCDGSLTISIAEGKLSLQAGDAVHIDAYITYEAQPGFMGCTYYISE